jgi:hypothetical protein
VEVLYHGRSQLRFALPDDLLWQLTFRSPRLVGVGKPGLGDKQPLVDQRVALPRGIGRKHSHLTVLDFPQGAAVLAGHAHRVLPFFRKPCLIDDQDAIGLAHLVLDQAMIRLQHRCFIPQRITDEALHSPHLATFHLQGDGLDRFALDGAELAHHIVEKLVPRFLPGQTRPKGRVESTEFVHE